MELRLENSVVDDRYWIDRCLSRGSYAEIFLARDTEAAGDPVIIKALNTGLQGTPDRDLEHTLIQNFQNEAIALDKVRHSNIIRRLGHGTAADLEGNPFHYLVLEYMPGGDLLALCRENPFSLDDAVSYFGQVAGALEFAHSQNVIHRDIKPTNLLLSRDRKTVKVADFGVAKIDVDDGAEITRVGTYTYAAPEHHPDGECDGANARLTPSADVYSLAKTIYTALTGRAPHSFARKSITELPESLMHEPWSAAMLAILIKATATNANDRYQSVGEFWQSVAALKSDELDSESTLVRPRLTDGQLVGAAAPMPAFERPAGVTSLQKARIVIELPEREIGVPVPIQAATVAGEVGTPATLRRESPGNSREARYATVAIIRKISWRDWLRRSFVFFIAVAFAGLVVSVYYNFADPQNQRALRRLVPVFGQSYGNGSISGATNVNMRSEPNGDVLTWLPAGTRVRVEDSRGGWLRVQVLEWNGPRPNEAPDGGWIDRRYVQLD